MKNLIGSVSMVSVAQRVANWRNTHTDVDRTHSLTHSHQHSYNQRSASSAITVYDHSRLTGRKTSRIYLYIYLYI